MDEGGTPVSGIAKWADFTVTSFALGKKGKGVRKG